MPTAKAMVLKGSGWDKFELRSFPLVEPGPGAVVADVVLCGICGTDPHIVSGALPVVFPTILGHEWFGRVKALGDGVTTDFTGKPLKEGDFITSTAGSCGKCWFCRNLPGRSALCENVQLIGGFMGRPVDKPNHFYGGFGEVVYIEPTLPILKLPDGLTEREMVLAEPMNVAVRVWERALAASNAMYAGEGVLPRQTVVILGSGPIGLCVYVVATLWGMSNIVLVDPIEERLAVARKLGAKHTLSHREYDTIQKRQKYILELTHGIGADVVIEAAGTPSAFEEAFKLVRRGGTIVEMGHFADAGNATVNPHEILYKDIQLFGDFGHTVHDFINALELMKKAKEAGIPYGDIVRDIRSYSEVPSAIKDVKNKVVPGKIAIRPS
jgi:threonine dehydrogenase-like Zn-dependent dehydrogenase